MNVLIPPKDRPEWAKMINGELEHNFRNYVLQTRTYQLRKSVTNKQITMQKAINELYELCSKYALAVQADFKIIFKTW